MCVIIVKNSKAEMPKYETLKICFKNNPDGAGIMYNGKDNKVHITKGYMNFEKFYQAYKTIAEKNPTATIVAHCRITTQGGVQQELCHPFPLTNKISEMKYLKSYADIGVAHNGVIHLTSDYRVSDRNDTMTFIEKYLYNIIQYKHWYKSTKTIKLIENLIDGSRLAILNGEGHITLIGNWVKDKKTGLLYSNESFKTLKAAKSVLPKTDWSFDQWLQSNTFAENKSNDLYEFDKTCCPVAENPKSDESYEWCEQCANATCTMSKWFYRTKN